MLGLVRRSWRQLRGSRQVLPFENHLDVLRVDHLALQKSGRNLVERRTVVADDLPRGLVAGVYEPTHFLVDLDGGIFREVAMLLQFATEEDLLIFLAEGDGSKLAHAKLADHLARQLRGLLDVVAGTGGHGVEADLFGDP